MINFNYIYLWHDYKMKAKSHDSDDENVEEIEMQVEDPSIVRDKKGNILT